MSVDISPEISVAGSILLDARCLPAVRALIGPEHFGIPWCRTVFRAACMLADEGAVVDPVTILCRANQLGEPLERETIRQALEVTPTAANAEVYARLVLRPPLEHLTAPRLARSASEIPDVPTRFLWYPYLPIGDYSVLMADGGTGKTLLCCGIAAALSRGIPLPGETETRDPMTSLLISAEDTAPLLKKRLQKSGAELSRVRLIDCQASVGMNISDGLEELEATVRTCDPVLVVLDPWHAFVGSEVDINRANVVRPQLQKLASLARRCDCALLLVSHVNKRAQGENANHAATGSTDFINASRSAMRVVFDEEAESRVLVHTKSNYAPYGPSVRFRIEGGGLVWDGLSDVTRATLERAARKRSTLAELRREAEAAEQDRLMDALRELAHGADEPLRLSYEALKERFGADIFGGRQPKRALDAVAPRLAGEGITIQSGVHVYGKEGQSRGIVVQNS